MKFSSAILARFDGLRATVVTHDGNMFTGSLAVNESNVNVDPNRGYDIQVEDAGFAACVFELGDDQSIDVARDAPRVELELGENVTISGRLIERADGVLLLAGEISVCAVPVMDDEDDDGDSADSTAQAEGPADENDERDTFENCVCVVDASKVTSGLPNDSADEVDDEDRDLTGCA